MRLRPNDLVNWLSRLKVGEQVKTRQEEAKNQCKKKNTDIHHVRDTNGAAFITRPELHPSRLEDVHLNVAGVSISGRAGRSHCFTTGSLGFRAGITIKQHIVASTEDFSGRCFGR